ncbi:MAG: D-alanine--D-alanine ligase [Bacteroidetes bacterium]|nr:D-alanine--D-alanine ligase [Bacteroidota bacterium]
MSNRIRIGIFFGGSSREREVSFAGGRTVYDNLDKSLFEAVPLFVDSYNQIILLDWQYIYKGSIRDFYPPVSYLKDNKYGIQVYAEHLEEAHADQGRKMAGKLGKLLQFSELRNYIDFAFLALHGNFGEDGTIQGLLEWHGIPYSGSGILPSALGMNKRMQKDLMLAAGMQVPAYASIHRNELGRLKEIHAEMLAKPGLPFVIKPANQGSSVGVSVINNNSFEAFEQAVLRAFFIQKIKKQEWTSLDKNGKYLFIQKLSDVKEGIGLPARCGHTTITHPDACWDFLDKQFKKQNEVVLESLAAETEVLAEAFIEGREFSCIVLRKEDGSAVALPPTEIVKGKEVFDYRSKYLPGLSRKVTPIDLDDEGIQKIRKACEHLFVHFGFHVYARIDGFLAKDGQLFLNDPNTTSGMMPSSFFFHQAAEIGLNPSQFLTYIIRTSLAERIASIGQHSAFEKLLQKLDAELKLQSSRKTKKTRVAVMMGGYSTERHISVESGRNIYEKLASSEKYEPFPVFVTGNDQSHSLYLLPIHVMLKDNADDIRDKVMHYHRPQIMNSIAMECSDILHKYSKTELFEPREISYAELKKLADAVFIALHGRPGEDGTIQKELNKLKIPYNGSGVESSQITINKFETNALLRKKGFLVADHALVLEEEWKKNKDKVIKHIEAIGYPLIAKPADDGCSSAVKKIKNREQLIAFADGAFRPSLEINAELAERLGLKPKEEFPKKPHFLVEKFVEKEYAHHFLEVTGGMLTKFKGGKMVFETFEPSESLAEGEILSLEEKFLAGQGQNITPARYAKTPSANKAISKEVQQVLKAAAKALGVEGYCRIDAFVRVWKGKKPEVIIIEINSLPGMTPATAIFHQCALNGYKPYEFIDALLEFGKERLKLKKGK